MEEMTNPLNWKFHLLSLLLISIIKATSGNPSQCNNYQILSDGTRSINNFINSESVKCDSSMNVGWYRFMGEAGTKLLEQPVDNRYGQPYRCHTHAVSWLQTPHPRYGEGVVSRTACFSWNGNNCFGTTQISVINCGGYFVYYLRPTGACYYRYCANATSVDKGSMTNVSCLPNYMGIQLNRHLYNVSKYQSITLKDRSCSAVINAAHIMLGGSLNSCGATRQETSSHIIYSNEAILVIKPQGHLISRDHDTIISFSCAYKKDGYADQVSFTPTTKIFVNASRVGSFSFEMELHQDNSYSRPYNSYPVNVPLDEQLYFQVKASASDNGLVLLIDKCFSTPNMNRNDPNKYTFINNGCIVDNTANFHAADRLKQRFSIQAFRYLTNSTAIYIHCLVLLCQKTSSDSRCTSGCNGNNVNRARRDVSSGTTMKNGEESYSDYYLLDQGPIALAGDKNGAGENEKNTSQSKIIFGMGSGIFALALLVGVLIVVIKRRRSIPERNCKEEIGIENPNIVKDSVNDEEVDGKKCKIVM